MRAGQKLIVEAILLAAMKKALEIAKDLPSFLRTQKQTEREFLLSFGFIPELRERYRAGNLTYGDIIRRQPGLFIPEWSFE